ncbi:hypothetical protein NSQ91_13675 [Paenibacillus sp. FSL R7-0048]|jgi:hypothetical protein|uniref:hypothetical protein n=1 Tax=Paenibacillus TaxID=44249 RepID=UPI00096DC330|nr:hypothetical protein [Paenibacillus odorifer]OMC74852.1 hypothetical protein BK121_02145 [Paenibacillus odorifer]OMD72120.1 hypothetical protein BSK48_09890 [Paenibacillus odorifer]OMD78843.1 hypothetical protein BSK50_08535 [Paenibacillus odorifer]OMD87747.1 hypothetical protein BSK53_01805 [Paenibacillus odorifer]OMD95106.1 hypothetical protein BSK67_10315 [Paenibacillus odorifer]
MKKKLRSITLRELEYSYILGMRIHDERSLLELKIYHKNVKLHPLRIQLLTWDDPIAGCPLNTGYLLQNHKKGFEDVYNLNHPQRIREWIEYGTAKGWDGTRTIEIINGLDAMQEMGYDITSLRTSI